MEMPRDLPYSEVRDLLQAIIQKRQERDTDKTNIEEYRKKDAEVDVLVKILSEKFMRSPPKGMTIMEARPLPPAEEDEFYPSSESHFDPVQELRRAVPDSKNETPANLDTTPKKKEETPEQIRQQELLEKLFTGGKKISAYSMKSSLYNTLKNAPSTLYRSISSVSKKVVKPFKKGMKSMKTKKYKKYRKY